MSKYFNEIQPIRYQGTSADTPLAYRYYDAKKVVLGKTMAEHLRFAVCCWHTFCWQGHDAFGANALHRTWHQAQDPMRRAYDKIDAVFEFVKLLGLDFYTFHDYDLSPEGSSIKESDDTLKNVTEYLAQKMQETGIKLLWGTANLSAHPRYMAGAATNPDPEIFAYTVAQVKSAIDATHQLNGANYVLWGGREGYETLLNTDIAQESQQLASFLSMLADYKHKIGFKGTLLIEPKPCEPTKHQYDFDSGHVLAFLHKYGLENEYKVNIEANHATLAGHDFAGEVAYACAHGIFGSIDANRGDPQLGWDTDQFPIDIPLAAQVMYTILKNGGFTTGGFNFDTKLRRQSLDLKDMFYGHISGIDTLARGLLIAADMIEQGKFQNYVDARYAKWHQGFGQDILSGKYDFAQISQYTHDHKLNPQTVSGNQELLELWLNSYV